MSKLIKNMGLYTLGNLIPKAAAFVLLPLYTRLISPEQYGIIGGMVPISFIATILFSLAIDRSVFRLYWDYKTDETRRIFLGSITLALWIISSLMIILLIFPLRSHVSLIYKSIPFSPYYIYILVTAYASVFKLVPRAHMRVCQNAKQYVTISLFEFFLTTSIVIWFVLFRKEEASGMLKGLMYASLAMVPYYVSYSFKTADFMLKWNILKKSLAFSLPVIPGLLSGWVLSSTDKIFIERALSLNDLGIYSLGYKIAGLVLVFSGAFQQAYNPYFYEVAAWSDQSLARKKLSHYNLYYIFSILALCFLISLFAKEAVGFLLDQKYFESHKIVPIIALAYFTNMVSSIFTLSIYQKKKTLWTMWVQICAAGTNVILNFLMVPVWGAYGAAWATVIVSVFSASVLYFMASRLYPLTIQIRRILTVLGLCSFIILLFITLSLNLYVSLFLKLTLCFCFFILFYRKHKIFIIRLINGDRAILKM